MKVVTTLKTLVFVIVLAAAPSAGAEVHGAPGTRWYRSNQDFMDLDPIPAGPGEGWTLSVAPARPGSDALPGEVRTLYLDGELRGREEVSFTPRGDVARVRRLIAAPPRDQLAPDEDSEPAEDSESDEQSEADGDSETDGLEEAFQVDFRYRPDGTVRSVYRCARGECILIRYAPPGLAGEESVRGPDLVMGIQYNVESRPEYIRRERPGEPVEEEWFQYRHGRVEFSRTVTGPLEVERRFADGFLIEMITRRDRVLEERVHLERRPDGTVLRETRETRNRRQVDLYFPDVEEGIVRERYVNDALVEQEEVISPGVKVVTRLRFREILYRTWYEDDEPRRREIYGDGEILWVEQLGE